MYLLILLLISRLASGWSAPEDGKTMPNYYYPPDSIIVHEYDVLHYDIDIAVDYPYDSLRGVCIIQAKATQNIDSIELHLGMVMYIDSLMIDGVSASFNRLADTLYIELPNPIIQDQIFEVITSYHGKPDTGLFYSSSGFYTFNQTIEAAKQWFPCYDWCWDKADSGVSIHVTVPDSLYAVSNGVLNCIDTLGNNKLRFNWNHNHSIATYLIAVSAYDYIIIERNFMGYPLIYYALPGYEYIAQNMLDSSEVVLSVMDTLIGPYPFTDEKLGQYQVSSSILGFAMEHQTCILYHDYCWNSPITHAHEIIHQWWGDDVTCVNYGNMFLNEGTTCFYQCFAALALRGIWGYEFQLTSQRVNALYFDSLYHYPILYSPDPFAPNVYFKGCWFHNMLRHLMGDSLYFPAMREYYQLHRGGNVSVTDLQNVMESYYQDSLDWFFYQWLEETDYPLLDVSWEHDNDTLTVNISQVQTFGPGVFKIPVELGVWSGANCTVQGPFWMEDSANLTVNINCSKPGSLTVDPDLKLYFKLHGIINENCITLVDDDGGGTYESNYRDILNTIGMSYILWDCNEKGLPPDSLLSTVKMVFWITGDRSDPLSIDRRDKIKVSIENDIPLAIFSPLAPEQLQGTAFLTDTLGCNYTGNTTNISDFTGQTGDPIGDGAEWFCIPIHSSYTLTPSVPGDGCVYWDTAGYGLVRNDQMKLVFSTVDIKYFYNISGYQSRQDLLEKILNYQGLNVQVEEIEQQPVVYQPNTLDIRYVSPGLIRFAVTVDNPTQLCIYDITGRIVQSWKIEGERVIEWRGEDINGRILPGGRYFAVMSSNIQTKQLILLK